MQPESRNPENLCFAKFEVDLRAGELRKQGKQVKLQDQPFHVLAVLLHHSGQVVTREELRKQIWPEHTFVDFDNSLNTAVNKLREALGDSADSPRFIETLPRRGYRFLAEVIPGRPQSPDLARKRKIPVGAAVSVLVGLCASIIAFLIFSPARIPRVVGVTQVTRSGRVDPWGGIKSDGSRIFFLERAGDRWNLMQSSVGGGEPQRVATPFRNTRLLDTSPDRTEFLIASFTDRNGPMPLWIWPVQGGAPQRVGEIMAYDAAWSGQKIIYSQNEGVYGAERDGTGSRLLAATQGRPGVFAWSPDHGRLRFTLEDGNFRTSSIWEMAANGEHLHRLFPGVVEAPHDSNGVWAEDGRYFFFEAKWGPSVELWAIQDKGSLLHRSQNRPVRLTVGPEEFTHPTVAGRKVFATGVGNKTEVIRFDPKSGQSVNLFQAWGAKYARDGQSVAYVSSTGSLRKIKANGTEEVSLTLPPLDTDGPAWSPDGEQIAFRGRLHSDQPWRLYLASAHGGSPHEIAPGEQEQGQPTWSPDGKLVAFGEEEGPTAGMTAQTSIKVLELATHQLSRLPDSFGKSFPSWSPDGRFIAALSVDERKLLLFDLRTKTWSQVAEGHLIGGGLTWSEDSKSLYFQDLLGPSQPVYRLRTDRRKIEFVTNFEPLLQGSVSRCGFQGLTPDGALVVSLLRNHADIYALSMDLP